MESLNKPSIREFRAADVAHVAAHMREADAREIWAATHRTPLASLEQSVRNSVEIKTAAIGDEPFALFGVGALTLFSPVGVPWMLATDKINDVAFTFARGSKTVVAGWETRYTALVNYVDERNASAVQWLRWLGFTIEPAQPYGLDKMPFHRFVKSRDANV